MSGAILPFPHVHKKILQYTCIWCWIVGCLLDTEGSERKRRDLFLSHCCVTCLEFLKKVKKILSKKCCLQILSALNQDNG
jgi:hypothetical protein